METPEGDAKVGRLHFIGGSEKSVRDILADLATTSDRTERAEWLRERLADGPMRSKDLEQEAVEHVFSKRTYERARRQVHVRPEQLPTGPRGKNEWWTALPGEAGQHDPA
ncbi:MAG TPA: hypothetical protein VEF71_26625 [Streptosporangiaceae bacterium]|nr:hypothetical protein [Streptosporangiaceae bacterium]